MSVRDALQELAENLVEVDWCVTGGFAVSIHTGVYRDIGDIDVLMRPADLKAVADRFDADPVEGKKRRVDGFTAVDEAYLETSIADVPVEIIAGTNELTVGHITYHPVLDDTLFEHAQQRSYHGVEVPIVAPEEVMVQKAIFNREKDQSDLRILLQNNPVRDEVLADVIASWTVDVPNAADRIRERLRAAGGDV